MRTLYEPPRGCGYRVDGGAYLVGEMGPGGNLPSVVEIDPPIPVDLEAIPFSRGVYIVLFGSVLAGDDCRQWLADSSAESLRQRDKLAWEVDRYGMPLRTRLQTGICKGMDAEGAEKRLHELRKPRISQLRPFVLEIAKSARGRRIARETAIMQEAINNNDWIGLLAAGWRLSGYSGRGEQLVTNNLKRIFACLGAIDDAIAI